MEQTSRHVCFSTRGAASRSEEGFNATRHLKPVICRRGRTSACKHLQLQGGSWGAKARDRPAKLAP
jgi:hypothetical protein